MKIKIRSSFFKVAAIILMIPSLAFAADWGINLDSGGNWSVGVGSDGSGAGGGGFAMPGSYGLPSGSILGIVQNLLFWLLAIFGIVAIIGFVVSGIMYLVSAGDDGMISRAKDGMKWSIVGIIVGLSGFIILQAISAWLSGSIKF